MLAAPEAPTPPHMLARSASGALPSSWDGRAIFVGWELVPMAMRRGIVADHGKLLFFRPRANAFR
jgi:hypothetical protein